MPNPRDPWLRDVFHNFPRNLRSDLGQYLCETQNRLKTKQKNNYENNNSTNNYDKEPNETKFKSARGVTGQLLSWASITGRRGDAVLFSSVSFSPALRFRRKRERFVKTRCLANQNTVQGDDALFSLTTGFGDTAIGFQALYSNTSGHGNNAVGVQALYSNIDGIDNTAIGYFTLLSNLSGIDNTAIGDYALYQQHNAATPTRPPVM